MKSIPKKRRSPFQVLTDFWQRSWILTLVVMALSFAGLILGFVLGVRALFHEDPKPPLAAVAPSDDPPTERFKIGTAVVDTRVLTRSDSYDVIQILAADSMYGVRAEALFAKAHYPNYYKIKRQTIGRLKSGEYWVMHTGNSKVVGPDGQTLDGADEEWLIKSANFNARPDTKDCDHFFDAVLLKHAVLDKKKWLVFDISSFYFSGRDQVTSKAVTEQLDVLIRSSQSN